MNEQDNGPLRAPDKSHGGTAQPGPAGFGDAPRFTVDKKAKKNEAVLGPFTIRDLTVFGSALLLFIASLIPMFSFAYNLWSLGSLFFLGLGIVLPLIVAALFVARRLSPETKIRVGSLSIDQFASVVASFTVAFFFLAVAVGFVPSMLIALIGALGLFAATVPARWIPFFAGDFLGREEAPAHVVARDAAVPVQKPRAAKAPKQTRTTKDSAVAGGSTAAAASAGAATGAAASAGAATGAAAGGAKNPAKSPASGAQTTTSEAGVRAAQAAPAAAAAQAPQPVAPADAAGPASSSAPATQAADVVPAAGQTIAAPSASASPPAAPGSPGPAAEGSSAPGAEQNRSAGVAPAAPAAEQTQAPAAPAAEQTQAPAAPAAEQTQAPAAEQTQAAGGVPTMVHPQVRREEQAGAQEPIGATVDPDSRAAGHDAHPVHEAFWFAVAQPRTAVDERTGAPAFVIEPGGWVLALEDRGYEFLVQHTDGRLGVLRDLNNIERG